MTLAARPAGSTARFSLCIVSILAGMLAGCSVGKTPTSTPPVAAVTVTVSGASQVRLGSTVQLTAVVANSANTAVTWKVDGVTGGSSADGTISATGLYTPPATIPSPNTVTISAVSQASPTVSGTLSEAVLNPIPVLTSALASESAPGTSYLLDVRGTSFINGAQIQVAGASVTTSYISATELQATVTIAAGTTAVAVDVLNPNPGSATSSTVSAQVVSVKASVSSAARLLDQATFGPTLTDIDHVQQVGLNAYLAEQFALPPTLLADIPATPTVICAPPSSLNPCEQSEWWQAAITAPDQLRQRVAFALAEMFVISTNSDSARAVTPFQNILVTDAFANFSTIMNDVTLSTGMGAYLNMLNSNKPATGQIANENYPREFMQLFTTGIDLLNPDGTLQLDVNGNAIPVYTELQVEAFARAYTGWTYASATGGSPAKFPNGTANYDSPMAPVESAHDTTAKILLNGTTLPAGQTAEADLKGAIANIFNHPNVGPFVCRQLIQHLVASSPSPAYVGRVAAVFADNGSGVRGDMKAVINAILTDTEARANDGSVSFDGGHLREPIFFLTGAIRSLGFVNTDPNSSYASLSNYSAKLGQTPYASGSVFNFFPPSYVIPGTTINAPEFSLENTASSILQLSLANSIVENQISGFKVDLSATSALGLMASNPGNLVDALSTMLMHAEMPTQMRTDLINEITPLTDMGQRVRVATYLVLTASLYKIEH